MSTRHYCYDTEFLEDGSTIDLISIGITCDDGREYYAVNSDADWERIKKDDWLMTNVVPHLPMRRGEPPYKFENRIWIWGLDRSSVLIKPKWLIANEVREFILESPKFGDTPWLWAYYGAYDHVALAQLFGKMIHLPDGIPMFTHELKQLMETMGGNWQPPERLDDEHNALADARWNLRVLQTILAAGVSR